MHIAQAVPQLDADFFNEKGIPKIYNPPLAQQQLRGMNIPKSFYQTGAILVSDEGVIISPKEQNDSISVPGSVQASDFPPVEFPSTQGVFQSQIDSPSISDMLHLTETGISLKNRLQTA